MERNRVWLLLMVVMLPIGCADNQPVADVSASASEWTLSVAAASDTVPIKAIWVGLGNPAKNAEVICVQSVEVLVRGLNGNVTTGTPTSPHSTCEREILVKGGESHFFTFDLSDNAIPLDSRFQVTVTFSNRGGSTQPPTLSWEGTGAEAQSAMRQMMTGA